MQNHLLQLLVYKNFYSSHYFYLFIFFFNQLFSLFPRVKMTANYAEICKVGNLEAD